MQGNNTSLEMLKIRIQVINEDWMHRSASALKLSSKNKITDAYHKFCIQEFEEVMTWLMTTHSDLASIKLIYLSKQYATKNMKKAIDIFIEKTCIDKQWGNLNDSLAFGDMFLDT